MQNRIESLEDLHERGNSGLDLTNVPGASPTDRGLALSGEMVVLLNPQPVRNGRGQWVWASGRGSHIWNETDKPCAATASLMVEAAAAQVMLTLSPHLGREVRFERGAWWVRIWRNEG
ncbi:hypothetical protein KQI63_15770 [bacterium]|nr:hypothetical protein [bacterium]